jgi:hypothetical protein
MLPGRARIIALAAEAADSIAVVVRPPVATVEIVARVEIAPNPRTGGLRAGDTATLRARAFLPGNREARRADLTWFSSDPSVAAVGETSGLVTAVGPGRVRIVAQSGQAADSIAVVVRQVALIRVEIVDNPRTGALAVGDTATLRARAFLEGNREVRRTDVTWRSSHDEFVTVDASGIVTARKAGEAYIVATIDGVRSREYAVVARPPIDLPVVAGTISGRITAEDGQPLAGVQVVLAGTARAAITRDNGTYTIANVSPGQYRLRAQLIGHRSVEQSITAAAGQTLTQDFTLRPVADENTAAAIAAVKSAVRPCSTAFANRDQARIRQYGAAGDDAHVRSFFSRQVGQLNNLRVIVDLPSQPVIAGNSAELDFPVRVIGLHPTVRGRELSGDVTVHAALQRDQSGWKLESCRLQNSLVLR